MTRATPHGRDAEGFTLVELLVAITLVVILTGILFGGLRFGTRAAGAVATRTDRSAEIALLYDFMQNELSDARLLPDRNNTAAAASSFEGSPDSLSFIAIPPAYLALGGFHRLSVGTQGEGPMRRLIVSWQQLPRGPTLAEPTNLRPSILLDHLASIRFSYFGVADSTQAPEWLDSWTDRQDLPQLVRLRVALADGSQTPDLIVAPRMAGADQ
jgi:general secretion pathway protein J